jgi:hypothetical protein
VVVVVDAELPGGESVPVHVPAAVRTSWARIRHARMARATRKEKRKNGSRAIFRRNSGDLNQGCQIFLDTIYQNGE